MLNRIIDCILEGLFMVMFLAFTMLLLLATG
jgi:hypothetical protein